MEKKLFSSRHIKCLCCGSEFIKTEAFLRQHPHTSFCSRKCSGLYHQKKKERICKNCGKVFTKTRGIFCSKLCVYDYRKKTGNTKRNGYWLENEYIVLYNGGAYIKEHRLVMEKKIGRKLLDNEVVHHIDGNRSNNKEENLLLMTHGEHSRLHREEERRVGKIFFGLRGIRQENIALNVNCSSTPFQPLYFMSDEEYANLKKGHSSERPLFT